MVRLRVFLFITCGFIARTVTPQQAGFSIVMAQHHIDINKLAEGITEEIRKLRRALTAIELYTYVTDHITGQYPNIKMGELNKLQHEVLDKINLHFETLQEMQRRQQEADRFAAHQKAKREHWKRSGFDYGTGQAGHYANTYGTDFSNDKQDYSFSFNVDEETYKRMTEDPKPKTNYAAYVRIPGLENKYTGNWSALAGYDKYHGGTGPFKWCRPLIKKGAHINAKLFESIPFQFIPSSLVL